VLTITANVAIGETIHIGGGIDLNVGTETMSVADSGGNSYTKDVEHQHTSSFSSGAILRAPCTVALTSGVSTITLTSSGAVNIMLLGAFKMASGDIRSPITTDGSNSNEGTTSTSATPGSVTPTFNPDFGVMVTVNAAVAVRTGTVSGNWTEMFDFGVAASDFMSIQINRLNPFTSSNAAINDTETLSAAPLSWVCMQVLYKSPLAGGAPARDTHYPIPFTQGAGGGSPGGGF
jgi:hypothetical protein